MLFALFGVVEPLSAVPAGLPQAQLLGWSLWGGDKPAATFVGAETCTACHAAAAGTYHQTAHARTSSWPTAETVRGHFSEGKNAVATANPGLHFIMELISGHPAETAHLIDAAGAELTRSEQIDLVVGSGRKGQTYLYWNEDTLFELPVSYWTSIDGWANSPGYTDGTANFDRPIAPRCLECHASSFVSQAPPVNRFVKSSLALGIDCEKCHGPGSEHVARFRSSSPPKRPADFAIVNPARLSRERQLDVCALCHESAGESIAPPLSYHAGDDLTHFLTFPPLPANASVDVHVGEVQLLKQSRCFRATETLTCATCHDVHRTQRDPVSFVSTCLRCHDVHACGEFVRQGEAIANRCIDCHMPLQTTAKIATLHNGQPIRPQVRNHRIAIYPRGVAEDRP